MQYIRNQSFWKLTKLCEYWNFLDSKATNSYKRYVYAKHRRSFLISVSIEFFQRILSIYTFIYIPRVVKVLLHDLPSKPKPLKINNDTSIFRFSRVRGTTYTHVFNPRIASGANRQSEAKRNCVRGGVYSARIHDLISLVGQSQTPTVFIEATSQQQHSRGRE